VGLGLAMFGMYICILAAIAHKKSLIHVWGCIVYGFSLLTLYSLSTIYHSMGVFFTDNNLLRDQFRRWDHAAIYVLIAGTYTPLTLIHMIGKTNLRISGCFLLSTIWLCAVLGICVKGIYWGLFPEWISTSFYLFMGWIGVLFVKPMIKNLPFVSFKWIIAGGLAYSCGIIWLTWDSLLFNHSIWHCWVILGSLLQFIGIISSISLPNDNNYHTFLHNMCQPCSKEHTL